MVTCEVCGNEIRSSINSVEIDGAILTVCSNCSRLGRPLRSIASKRANLDLSSAKEELDTEYEIDPDYNIIVRQARERLGLSQEALGRMINVKPSVISNIEKKRLKPDIVLARKLMHHLKVNLLVPVSELYGNER